MFDQEPPSTIGSDQDPRAFELLAAQGEFEFSLGNAGRDILLHVRGVGSEVSHHDGSTASLVPARL